MSRKDKEFEVRREITRWLAEEEKRIIPEWEEAFYKYFDRDLSMEEWAEMMSSFLDLNSIPIPENWYVIDDRDGSTEETYIEGIDKAFKTTYAHIVYDENDKAMFIIFEYYYGPAYWTDIESAEGYFD